MSSLLRILNVVQKDCFIHPSTLLVKPACLPVADLLASCISQTRFVSCIALRCYPSRAADVEGWMPNGWRMHYSGPCM